MTIQGNEPYEQQQKSSLSSIKEFIRKRCVIAPPVDEDPRLLSPAVKNGVIVSIALVACTGGFASTVYFPGIPYITKELNADPIVTTLTTSLFILFMGTAPVVWASLSEYYRVRRFLFLVAMLIFAFTSLAAAFVHNIWALVVLRCVQSVGVSSGNSIGAGIVSDLYPIEQRGGAFGKYMAGAIFGPLLGPIIGGFLIMTPLGWRATFWCCFVLGILIFLATFLFTPETYRVDSKFDVQLPVSIDEQVSILHGSNGNNDKNSITKITKNGGAQYLSINQSKSTATKTTDEDNDDDTVVKEALSKRGFNPFASFVLLRHPFILMSSIAAGLFYGAMFSTEAILPNAFTETYGLTAWQTGLSYVGAGVGNLGGALVGNRLSDRLLLRSRRLRGGIPKAEDRLTMNIWFAGLLCAPVGNLLFGWVVERKWNIWIAIVAFGLQCFGSVQVVTAVTAYLVDSVPGRGAGATAAANFIRFMVACILSFASTPMIDALGAGWTSTLFACLSWFGLLIVLVLKIWGESIRRFSGF